MLDNFHTAENENEARDISIQKNAEATMNGASDQREIFIVIWAKKRISIRIKFIEFLAQIMRKDDLKTLMFTEDAASRGKYKTAEIMRLCKSMVDYGLIANVLRRQGL